MKRWINIKPNQNKNDVNYKYLDLTTNTDGKMPLSSIPRSWK